MEDDEVEKQTLKEESKELSKEEKEREEKRKKRYKMIDEEFITEENIIKIKSILVCLESINKYREQKPKSDIECLYSQINNFPMKERIVLETLLNLSKSNKNPNKPKFLKYENLLENNDNDKMEENEFDIDKKIFKAVGRVAHKTLHKEKNEKNNKICQIYNDLCDFEFKENDKSIGYNNIDKLINNLKEKRPYLEFIAIKAIIISMKNITQELINIYYKTSEEMNLNLNLNIITEENDFNDDDESEIIEINPKIFEILFNDYIFISNRCSFLENYFIESFNNFRNKNKMDFTLSSLFTDIFFDGIFHNKALCKKFINIYIGNDKCNESVKKILGKIIKIISDKTIPLKNEIIKILSLNNIEYEDIDLISSTITQKNINFDFIKNEKILNNVSHKAFNPEEVIDNNINLNFHNKNEIKEEIKEESKEETKKEEQKFSENEMENKTVDEIYKYINDNNDNKIKKKKRNKKKKNKKNDKNKQIKIINEENKIEDYDDEIINNFKQDIINNMIDANKINKIKPFVSENFLKIISEKY